MRVSANKDSCTPRMNGSVRSAVIRLSKHTTTAYSASHRSGYLTYAALLSSPVLCRPLLHQHTVPAALQSSAHSWAIKPSRNILQHVYISGHSSLSRGRSAAASVCCRYRPGVSVASQLSVAPPSQYTHMTMVEQQAATTSVPAVQQTSTVGDGPVSQLELAKLKGQPASVDSVRPPGLLPKIEQQQQPDRMDLAAQDDATGEKFSSLGSAAVNGYAAGPKPAAAAAAASGSDDSSAPAVAPGSSSRGRGRKGQRVVRSRAESHDYVMRMLAKNEAEDIAAIDPAQMQVESMTNGVTDSAAAAAAAAMKTPKQRSNKRKSMESATPAAAAAAAVPDLGMNLLPADLSANGATSNFTALLAELAVTAGGGMPVVAAAAAAAKPKRAKKRPAAAPAGVEDLKSALAAAADGDDSTVLVKSRRGRKKTNDAAVGSVEGANGSAGRSKRGGRKKAAAAAVVEAAVDGSEGDGNEATAAVEAEAPPSKPVRRTKKLIAAEVADAARLGVFNELSSLVDSYSHVALFTSSNNGNAWQQLMDEASKAAAEGRDVNHAAVAAVAAAAAAAEDMEDGVIDARATVLAAAAAAGRKGDKLEAAAVGLHVLDHEQQQQQLVDGGSSSSSSSDAQAMLCRLSGLCRQQQVWLPTVYHGSLELSQPTQSYIDWKDEQIQQIEAEEAAAAAAEEAAAAAAAAEGEDGEASEQQKSKKKQKKPQQRKFTRSSSSTPYGQGVLSSQPSAPVELPFPIAAAAAAAAGNGGGDGIVDGSSVPAATTTTTAATPSGITAAAAAAAAAAREARLLPNLGYACLCQTMRNYEVFCSRDCVKKTRDGPDGLAKVSQLALANARDLLPLILWNEAHGIRLFRLSSCILPWMTSYEPEELPDWLEIQKALREAGDAAKRLGHRLTFHPSEYCKIAGERPDWVSQSVKELEVHSRIFDEMGFLPASPYNKINIHVGGTYGGEKEPVLRRFAAVVNDRLSPNCKARMTVENDDRANMYSVKDLMLIHELTGIPIVFDFHHWKFCTGGQTQEEAFKLALTTWPKGVRPIVHWSESPEDPDKMRSAHSDYIDGPINLFGLEGEVDVMIESKAKELALLEYRQAVVENWTIRPKQRNAELAAVAAAAKAEAAAARAEAKAAKAALLAEAGDGDDAVTPARGVRRSRATAAAAIAAAAAAIAAAAEDDDHPDEDAGRVGRGVKTPTKGSAKAKGGKNSKKGTKKTKKRSKETSSEEDDDEALQLTDDDDE